jgi:hypothetical protein
MCSGALDGDRGDCILLGSGRRSWRGSTPLIRNAPFSMPSAVFTGSCASDTVALRLQPCRVDQFETTHWTLWLMNKGGARFPRLTQVRHPPCRSSFSSARSVRSQRIGDCIHAHAHLQRQRPARHVVGQIQGLLFHSPARRGIAAARTVPWPSLNRADPWDHPRTRRIGHGHWP